MGQWRDDDYLEDVKEELIHAKRLAVDEDGKVLVWRGPEPGALESHPANGTPPSAPDAPSNVESVPVRAERRQLTVLFVDLVGSTELSRRLDPEDMRELMIAYQNAVASEITRFEGYVARYMGDGVLAYFGWPRAHEDEAERAVRAALATRAAVAGLSSPLGEPLVTRTGIATGLVVVGDAIGAGAALEHAVAGETPNLAARLQSLAEPGGVVIAASTRRLLGELFELVDLGGHELKGFAEPVRSWRVVGPSETVGRFEARQGTARMPLVGRSEELDLLSSRWRRAKGGDGQVLLLSGEPGIGKSRLTQALRGELTDEPCTVIGHYCSVFHVNSALHPVIGRLERAASFEPEDSAEQRLEKLEALLDSPTDPETIWLLAELLSIRTDQRYPPTELSPQRRKQRTLEILGDEVVALAAKQPVLAIYEDVHWADPSTGLDPCHWIRSEGREGT